MEVRKCVRCGEWKDALKKNFRTSRGGGFRNYCRSCEAKYKSIERKLQMLEALGYQCACCGERNPLLLTLDHVKNNGNIHRQIYQCHQIYWVAKKQGWAKDEWQVLCMGCNWGKRLFGVCPHKLGKSPEQQLEEMRKVLEWKNKRFPRFQEKQVDRDFKESRPWKSAEMKGNKFAAGPNSRGGTRKVTAEQVLAIRALRGVKSRKQITEEYGISVQQVSRIWMREAWRHL